MEVRFVAVSKDATKTKLTQIEALRLSSEARLLPELRRGLNDRSPYVVAKAAAIAAQRFLLALVPELLTALDRLMRAAPAIDPLAQAKVAVIKALKELDCRDPAVFLRGLHHVQLKAAWGEPVDVAAPLRSACALALVGCDVDDAVLLREFVDYLVIEKEQSVRCDVVRAIGEIGGTAAIVLLRLKALAGDPEAEVIGACFAALMGREPRESTPFVERFLRHERGDFRFEAACVLAAAREPAAQAAVAAFWNTGIAPDMRRAIVFSCAASSSELAAKFLLSLIADQRADIAVCALSALAASRFRQEYRERALRAAEATGDPQRLKVFHEEFEPTLRRE